MCSHCSRSRALFTVGYCDARGNCPMVSVIAQLLYDSSTCALLLLLGWEDGVWS